MHTGDLATIDAEGYGNIVGRIKDMVIRGGENLYPREIEEYLFKHPKIQDVQVFGVADDALRRGTVRLGARARRRDADARKRCAPSARARSPTTRSRATSNSSRSFPMTVTGKAQKFLMRKAVEERLGLKRRGDGVRWLNLIRTLVSWPSPRLRGEGARSADEGEVGAGKGRGDARSRVRRNIRALVADPPLIRPSATFSPQAGRRR